MPRGKIFTSIVKLRGKKFDKCGKRPIQFFEPLEKIFEFFVDKCVGPL
jgi:hypothetical protein